MGKRPKNVKFTRVPYGENEICDQMNHANDNFDSWEPKTNIEKRLKEAIVNIENNIINKTNIKK
jgi:hypothetical protein